MLENAVSDVDALNQVRVQAKQQTAHYGKILTYEQYCVLLLSAAQTYDKKFQRKRGSKQPRRHVYEHDIDYDAPDDGEFYDANDYDIDSDIATIEANATNWRNGPRLTRDQWCALDPSAQKLWDELSNEAKAIILKKPPPAPNPS